MFEFTLLTINLMREGKLYAFCNETGNVFENVAAVYSCLFLNFMCTYIEHKHNITKMDELNNQIEKQAWGNIKELLRET